MVVDVYILASQGASNEEVAAALRISPETLNDWLRNNHPATKPELRYALEKGRAPKETPKPFKDYVYGRLAPELQALWDRIDFFYEHQDGYNKVKALLAGKDETVVQHLFVNALVHTNFDLSRACRLVCISKRTVDHWNENDPDFPRLMDELQWHKKNFFESALNDLVLMRNPQAVIFANKTINRDRGYGDKMELNVNGTITHKHLVSMGDLEPYLDFDTKVKLLDAMRAARAKRVQTKPAPALIMQSNTDNDE